MREHEELEGQGYLSRSEVELELARLALVVMRAVPHAFDDHATPLPAQAAMDGLPGDPAERLLRRTRPEHRAFVEGRLLELSRCLSAVRNDQAQGTVSLDLGAIRHPVTSLQAPRPGPHERR